MELNPKLHFWSKIPKIRPARPTPTAARGRVLRAARAAALGVVAGMIAMANGAAFAESYRGLFDWAHRQGMAGIWAALFPLQVDSFILVGELVLFIAALDQWRHRHRFTAWCAALTGLAVSVAGNIGHVTGHTIQARGTAAIPPMAAFAALGLGMALLKRVLEHQAAELAGVGPVTPEQEIPTDNMHAARMALAATHAAGNPISQNQLIDRFNITRSTAQRIRREVTGDDRA
jgi:hypothetical protein